MITFKYKGVLLALPPGCQSIDDKLAELRRADANHAHPCPACGGPSMKDARVNPVKYTCFECDHIWSKGEANRRDK